MSCAESFPVVMRLQEQYIGRMERLQSETSAIPVAALALAAGAAASFGVGDGVGFLSPDAEALFVLTWLLGWLLLTWATIVAGGYAVWLGLRWRSRRRVSQTEVAILAAALALIVLVMLTHPLWGTGSAVGG